MKTKLTPLYLFSFLMIMPVTALYPVLPMIRDEIGASYSQISLFVGFIGVVRVCFAFPSGFLVDKFDRKKILFLSGFLSVSGLVFLSFSHNLLQLIVSRILIGMGSITCNITILVLLTQIAPLDSKGSMISMNNVAHNGGAIVSSAFVGMLAGWYNWRLPFLVIAVAILFTMIPIARIFNDRRSEYQRGKDQKNPRNESYLQMNSKPSILKLAPVFAISVFAFFYRSGFRHTLIPLYGKDVFHFSVVTLGFYISLTGCVAMGSILIFGFLSDRYGRKAGLIPGICFSGAAVFAILLPEHLNPLLISCVLAGVGASINSMPNILISDFVPSGSLGRLMGINRVFGDSGYFLGPIIVGSLMDHFGFRVPLYVVAGFSLFMLIFACFSVHNKPMELRRNCSLQVL